MKHLNTKFQFKFTYNIALLLISVVLFLVIGFVRPIFFSPKYISETIKQVVEIGIMVLPVTLIVISGGIDFSMNASMILSAIVSSIVFKYTNSFVAILVALVIGLVCGLTNGVLIAKLKLPPLVTTLATMYLFKGIAEGLTMGITSVGASVGSYPEANFLGIGKLLGIPTQFWVLALLAVLFYIGLSKTYFGRYIYAVGLNQNAAKYSGIKVDRIKIALYVLGGFIYAIAGLVYLGRFSSLRYDSADPITLQVLTTVVLGGTSIAGGSGDIKGSVLGIVIIAILKSGMNVLFIPQTTQKIVLGLILLGSLMIFEVIRSKTSKKKIVDNLKAAQAAAGK